MASFESRVSEIFDENPRLARKTPFVIRKIFQESEFQFKRRLKKASEDILQLSLLRLYDIQYIDFYFDELNDCFLNWVIDNYPERFTKPELDEMRAQAISHLDYYEVQEVIPGKGSYIKSLFADNEGFLKDVSSSSRLVKWDIFLARCYQFRDNFYATGSLSLFNPAVKKFILKRLEDSFSEYCNSTQETQYSHFAKNQWETFYQIEREIQEREKNKKFYTPYGELQFREVRFRVQDIQALLEKIESLKEFNFIEAKFRRDKKKRGKIKRYQFDWLTFGIEEELESIKTTSVEDGFILTTQQLDTKGNQLGIEAIGTLYVDKYLARLETRSVELAEFAAHHFVQIFTDALTFKRIVKVNQNAGSRDEVKQEQTEDVNSASQNPELYQKIEEQYLLNLLDEKIPALNNLSPRAASQDPATKPLLIEWLKGMENQFERRRQAGEQTISMKKIKKALDIHW